jgi:hypothetical protein
MKFSKRFLMARLKEFEDEKRRLKPQAIRSDNGPEYIGSE